MGGNKMNSIYNRRSVRMYEDRPIEKEKIMQILKAAMQAPSAANQQPWHFLVVEDKEQLEKLGELTAYSGMCKTAACVIVVMADEQVFKAPLMWQQDCAAATQNLMLEAVEQGLGSVWIGVAPHEDRMNKIKEQFELSDNLLPFALVSMGYPKKPQEFVDRFQESKIHFEKV